MMQDGGVISRTCVSHSHIVKYRTRFGVNPGRLLTVLSPWDDDVEGLAVACLP